MPHERTVQSLHWSHVLFFVVALSLWCGAHYYVGKRLLAPLALTPRRRRLAVAAIVVVGAISPAAMFSRVAPTGALVDALRWIGFVYMGFFVILLPAVFARDVLLGGRALVARLLRREDAVTTPERRRFLLNLTNVGASGLSAALGGLAFFEARRLPEVLEVAVPLRRLPAALAGYRIVQLTDLHVGPTIKRDFVSAVVDRALALDPDLIVITGDLVDGFVPDLRHDVEPLGRLRARDGVYYVTGNHEYYWDVDGWCDEVARLGIRVLTNTHVVLERTGARVVLAGATDYSAARYRPDHRSDPVGALRGAPDADVRILLAHQPRSLKDAVRAGFDLQISGHTHGGQLFPWTLLVGLAHPVAWGLTRVGEMLVYVSKGTGYWGPPMRLDAPSEITLLRLTGGAPGST